MYTPGGIDPAHYQGEINYVPLKSATYWEIALDDVQVSKWGQVALLCVVLCWRLRASIKCGDGIDPAVIVME